MEIISVKNLKFTYDGQRTVLNGISFSVQEGEYTGIIGESGCGKSTLCHILCGIIPNVYGGEISGHAVIDGRNLRDADFRELAQTVGFVMQDPDRQIVTSTVEDELAFGPENFCIPPEEIKRRVDDVINLLGMESFRYADPNRLSGGQKHIVTIGSILTLNPEIIILDEPYSSLDEENTERVRAALTEIRKTGKTVLIVEHDHSLIADADKWIVIDGGRIQAEGTPAEIMSMHEPGSDKEHV